MKLRINYKDGTEKYIGVNRVDIIPVPKDASNFPIIFNINNVSKSEIDIHTSSNIISDISEIENMDFIE